MERDNSGILFKNNKKTSEKHPDLNGTIMIAGKKYRLSAWTKQGQSGKFLSLSISDFTPSPTTSTYNNDGDTWL